VSFLMEFKVVELLCGVIAKSRAPRATVLAVTVFSVKNINIKILFKTYIIGCVILSSAV